MIQRRCVQFNKLHHHCSQQHRRLVPTSVACNSTFTVCLLHPVCRTDASTATYPTTIWRFDPIFAYAGYCTAQFAGSGTLSTFHILLICIKFCGGNPFSVKVFKNSTGIELL
ncbi:hypothetical protein TKK_0014699 [Trichogramma kaykai]